jgi:hypothetical protein
MPRGFEEMPLGFVGGFVQRGVGGVPGAGPAAFADEADRRRYTPAAIKAFLKLAETWGLSGAQASALLAVSTSTWERVKRSPDKAGVLGQDQLTRLSALIGIYKGLHLLFADDLADRWVGLPNRGPLFGGQTPVDSMIEGGIPQMLDVRRHVDALRGGI